VSGDLFYPRAPVSLHEEDLKGGDSVNTPEKPATEPIRERILQRFAAWLDGALDSEPLPEGIASDIWDGLTEKENNQGASKPIDWYSLWEAMTTLTQEIKLQGRSFKQLSDNLAPVASLEARVDASIQAHAETLSQTLRLAEEARTGRLEREREVRRETEQRVRGEMLTVLIEMKDRLSRGLQSLLATRQANLAGDREDWWERLVGGRKRRQSWLAATEALEKGYTLSLESLEETLTRFDLREIPCQGYRFDARTMTVVDRQETIELEEGTVLEVYRTGYEWQGELFRPAQVKVAVRASQAKSS
jgi:molecular chaperone GrpE